jgi:hypothetical protein
VDFGTGNMRAVAEVNSILSENNRSAVPKVGLDEGWRCATEKAILGSPANNRRHLPPHIYLPKMGLKIHILRAIIRRVAFDIVKLKLSSVWVKFI